MLRAALMRFGVLCGRIRQQKCPQYATQLLPIVTQLLSRQDDSLQVSNHQCGMLLSSV